MNYKISKFACFSMHYTILEKERAKLYNMVLTSVKNALIIVSSLYYRLKVHSLGIINLILYCVQYIKL